MNFPLNIQFRNMAESDFISNAVWGHAEHLARFFDRIVSAHVVVSAPHRHQHNGKIYHVQVRLSIPGSDVFVSTQPDLTPEHEDVYVAIRDAFDATRRQLEDAVRKLRGDVKPRCKEAHAKVDKLFAGEGYGFLRTSDQREIYFHENSVLNREFGKLKIGDEVRFSEEMGEKGPQVTSMTLVGKSGHAKMTS